MATAASKQDEAAIAFKLLRTEVSAQKLSTQFIGLCKYVRDKQEPAPENVVHSILKELSQLEFQARRHVLAEQANVNDRQFYESKQAHLEHEIERAQAVLEASKSELKAAREEKQQKNECEMLRLKCAAYPKRSVTAAEIAAINQELQALQTETEQTLQEYELRKKKLAVLLRMVDELEVDFAEEQSDEMEQDVESNASDRAESEKDMMQE